ncbi:MAG TPA: aldolase [Allosphingosinicella sp.]|jgi:serine kinase of HPr protein (carbohydrate metabolism regulator)
MSTPTLSSETLHASCVAKDGRAVLISGRSGSGKSDLALRLIDRGASLVSDDYTIVRRVDGRLLAKAPANIQGKMEVRGVGIVPFAHASDVPVSLLVDLDLGIERLPERRDPLRIAGVDVPVVAVNALEASAPVKVEVALEHFGLKV